MQKNTGKRPRRTVRGTRATRGSMTASDQFNAIVAGSSFGKVTS